MVLRKPLRDILVKPAGPDCNMACGYCFYSGKCELFKQAETHRMNRDVLEEMIRQLMIQSGGEVSIGWQGGEPTLMGREFFEEAVMLEKRYGRGKVVGNGLQTNGILVDRAWARFFREYSFLVGLSIDGPEHVHDHYRQTRRGKGSWTRVRDSAKLMLDEGVSVNALTVVNDYSVRFPREIYEFHKGLGLTYMQFIPCVELSPENDGAIAPFSVSAEAYGEFLCTVFDLWRADFADELPTTSIRFFESLLFVYAGFPAPECTLAGECGPYVVVEHNGDVYSCDFFVEEPFRLGNVMEGRLDEMLNSAVQLRFGKRKADLAPSCRECQWLRLCRGGCVKDRVHNPHDPKANYLCRAFKHFFAHADGDMRRLVAEWRKRQKGQRPI